MKHTILGAILGIGLIAPAVQAQVADDVVRVELLTGWRDGDDRHYAALQFTLRDGWKTYWRVPGEGGIPPQFDWNGSDNVDAVRIHWPTPKVFDINGLQSFGYGGEFILPLELRTDPSDPSLRLSANISMGVCETVCVPVSLQIDAELTSVTGAKDTRILAAMADRPVPAAKAGIGPASCRFEPISDGLRVTASIPAGNIGQEAVAVFELPDPAIWISPSSTERRGDMLTSTAEMVPPNAQPFALSRSDIRITILGGAQAVDIQGCSG